MNRPHLLAPGLALILVACSSGNKQGAGADAGGDAAVTADAGPDAPPPPDPSRVYCHSGKELFRLDTRTNATVDIGPFGAALGTASMTDIAVNKKDEMIGVSLNKIWRVDTATGTATLLKAFAAGTPNMTSLSYVPEDLGDPDSAEILVAADDHGDVFQIDPATGMTAKLGNYGMNGTDQIISSGDIVAVRGAGIFATVDVGPTLSNNDRLARIDPTTWAATLVGTGDLGHDKLFGLAYWGGSLYGFADSGATAGAIIAIDPTTAAVTPVVGGTTPWFGAGVTTDAPIIVN